MNSAFVRSENKNAPGGAVRISIMSVRKSAAFQYAGKCGLIRVQLDIDLSGSHGMKFSFQQDISEEECCA